MASNDVKCVDKLSGAENWPTWKFQMKHILLARGLFKYADGSKTLQQGANEGATADFLEKCQKALTAIVMR